MNDLQEGESNITMDTRLDLDIDIQVQVEAELQRVRLLPWLTARHLPECVTEELTCLARSIPDALRAQWLESAALLLLVGRLLELLLLELLLLGRVVATSSTGLTRCLLGAHLRLRLGLVFPVLHGVGRRRAGSGV